MYSLLNENNNNQYGNQQMDIYTQIQLILNKISKLEDSNNNLSQLLNDEISQRQILEKHSTTSIDAFSGQLNILKNNYDKIEEVLFTNFSKNENKSSNNNNIEESFKKELELYHNELNNKITGLENKINLNNKEYKNSIKEINDKIDLFNNEIKPFKEFQKKNKSNLQKLKEDFQVNLNNNQNFLNEVNSIILDFKKNMDVYNSSYNKYCIELKKLSQSVILDRDSNNMKIKEMEEELNLYINEKTKEWENFENHLLNEYQKFINFIQNKVEEYNEGMKKLVDYNTEDVNLIKEKMNIYQEGNNKLRIDIFKGINDTQDFFEKKYKSIISMMNK